MQCLNFVCRLRLCPHFCQNCIGCCNSIVFLNFQVWVRIVAFILQNILVIQMIAWPLNWNHGGWDEFYLANSDIPDLVSLGKFRGPSCRGIGVQFYSSQSLGSLPEIGGWGMWMEGNIRDIDIAGYTDRQWQGAAFNSGTHKQSQSCPLLLVVKEGRLTVAECR